MGHQTLGSTFGAANRQEQREGGADREGISRRCMLGRSVAGMLALGGLGPSTAIAQKAPGLSPRPWVQVRGIYGGYLDEVLDRGKTPADYGVNAIWVGSGGLNAERIKKHRDLGLRVFAEFNTMHVAGFLKDHPDAAPIGADGKPAPPADRWQGVSAHHAGYRKNRMDEFRRVVETFDIDGIWLDYHHAHASWERAEPILPDTDFSPVALAEFTETTGIELPKDVNEAAALLLGTHQEAWTKFRCDVFTDWVREFREIQKEVRPEALLGTFHCPWSPEDYDGAITKKLAIDLPAQAKYLDIFSIMPYHARFGHPRDPDWITRQTATWSKLLSVDGDPESFPQIWPIVQLADWGETVSADQVASVIDAGTRQPSTGVMAFHWSGLSGQWDKVEALGAAYRAIRPETG